jgi:predicted nucleotidyltransferase
MFDPAALAIYRRTAQARHQAQRAAIEARRQRAWQVARSASTLLRQDFGVRRVVAFGSIVSEKLFHARSDIDLAVWGLDEGLYFRSVGVLQGLDPEFSLDVIRFEARSCLDEYRGFRHVVRNVYAFNLRPARIEELSDGLPACWKTVGEDLQKFIEFLDAVQV